MWKTKVILLIFFIQLPKTVVVRHSFLTVSLFTFKFYESLYNADVLLWLPTTDPFYDELCYSITINRGSWGWNFWTIYSQEGKNGTRFSVLRENVPVSSLHKIFLCQWWVSKFLFSFSLFLTFILAFWLRRLMLYVLTFFTCLHFPLQLRNQNIWWSCNVLSLTYLTSYRSLYDLFLASI